MRDGAAGAGGSRPAGLLCLLGLCTWAAALRGKRARPPALSAVLNGLREPTGCPGDSAARARSRLACKGCRRGHRIGLGCVVLGRGACFAAGHCSFGAAVAIATAPIVGLPKLPPGTADRKTACFLCSHSSSEEDQAGVSFESQRVPKVFQHPHSF